MSQKQAKRDDRILAFGVWGHDETDYTVLRNGMVTTRRPSKCAICFEAIPVGARVRAQTERLNEGKSTVQTFRFCPSCCAAMADDRDGLKIEARYGLGRRNAEVQRTEPKQETPR